jgi:Pyruvate/2-oxoacid:ferredoxin oxidoreductase delta subunit
MKAANKPEKKATKKPRKQKKKVPSGVPSYRFLLDEAKCIGCSVCAESCPNNVLENREGHPVAVHQERCEGCNVCVALCAQDAITIEEG